MASATKTIKNFSDTADSFRPNSHFDYHWKRGECEYKLLLENQVNQLSSFLHEGTADKDKVDELIRKFQRQTDAIIGDLLTQTTQIRRKMRTQQEYYQAVIRQLKSKVRKLTEENLELTSNLHASEKMHNKTIQQLNNGLNDSADSAKKQIQGLQSLLSQYQNVLQEKDQQITDLKEACLKNQALYEQSKAQILNQAHQLQNLRGVSESLKFSLKTHESIQRFDESKQISLAIDFDQRLKEKQEEIQLIVSSELEQRKQIESLLMFIEQLKRDLTKEQAQRIKCEEREKSKVLRLQQSSDRAIKMIREKYKSKIKKIGDLLSRELKKTKRQIEALKIFISREIQSSLKETRGVLLVQVYKPCNY